MRRGRRTTPVTVVVSADGVLRDAAVGGLLCDEPGVVVVRHDLGPHREDGLRRVVVDATGVVDDVTAALEHSCLSCALREDALPAVVAAARDGRWRRVVLVLPVTAEPVPAVMALADGEVAGRPVAEAVHLDGVVAVAAAGAVVPDLFGDDLLLERGLGLDEVDERSVGEVVARQLEEADVVLLDGPPSPAAGAALRHLAGARAEVLRLHEATGAEVLAPRRPAAVRGARSDLRRLRHPGVPDEHGVWTLLLESSRPLHPGRLVDRAAELGGSPLRARGTFWVPTRPGTACAWDGAGGRLSIGPLAGPGLPAVGGPPVTRLLVTGRTGPGEDEDPDGSAPEQVRRVFEEVLATPAELAAGWPTGDDGLSPWLGAPDVVGREGGGRAGAA